MQENGNNKVHYTHIGYALARNRVGGSNRSTLAAERDRD